MHVKIDHKLKMHVTEREDSWPHSYSLPIVHALAKQRQIVVFPNLA